MVRAHAATRLSPGLRPLRRRLHGCAGGAQLLASCSSRRARPEAPQTSPTPPPLPPPPPAPPPLARSPPPRGRLLDRRGELLAVSEQATGGFYVRRYPQPSLGPLIGLLSPQLGTTGPEQAAH